MKLTLFTISNEQIKEQLSKLQTKVESLETVKDVQDKIISAKDSQITFLQGEISNITSWVTWGATAVITLASAAFIYIKFLERKAKKKIEEAENTLQLVTEKLAEVENSRQQTESNLTESDSRIEQLDVLIEKSNNIATIAQEKIDKLEEKQLRLQKQANAIENLQKFEMITTQIHKSFSFIQRRFEKDRSYCVDENKVEFYEFNHESSDLEIKHLLLSAEIKDKITQKINIPEDDIRNIEQLQQELDEFTEKYIEFSVKLRSQNSD